MKPKICTPSRTIAPKIKSAIKEYKETWKNQNKVYEELCFCLLTPQSSAKQAAKAITLLKEHYLLDKGGAQAKEKYVRNVRFFRTKAKRLEIVQQKFPKEKIKKILTENGIENNVLKCREFLLKEVNGYGYKEASHFLRNIGFGEDIAILDRHILKNLKSCGVIKEIPKHLSKKEYLRIEEEMKKFCKKHDIKLEELDLIFWSNETGEVFK